jgi:GYF domain 2
LPDQTDVAWYIERDGQRFGPFSAADFARFEAEKQLAVTDYVWRTGLDGWVTYAEFQSRFAAAAQAPRITRCATCVVIRKLIRVPLDLALTVFEVVTKPTDFAKRRIDAGPRDLYRALYFYFNLFTVAFLIASSLAYLASYTGDSQFRELATLALQIGAALPILYVFNIALRQRVRFSGILQAVLYVDGIYLVLGASVGGALAYLTFDQAVDKRELDIIGTAFEKCLSGHSFVYWLIRGDLQFFNHVPTEATTFAYLREHLSPYLDYVLFFPFCILFGKMMKGRYGARVWPNVILAALAFVIVANGVPYARDKASTAIAVKSQCPATSMQSALATYNQATVVKQIAERINRGLKYVHNSTTPWVATDANGLVMDLRRRVAVPPHNVAQSLLWTRDLYCKNPEFWVARANRVPLLLIARDPHGNIIHQEQITPATCSATR